MFAAFHAFAGLASLVAAAAPLPSPTLGFLEGIGTMEMMLVAIIGLLLFGGKGLPDMARTVGRAVREFKKATATVEDEVRRVMHEEPEPQRRRPAPEAAPISSPKPAAPAESTPPADGHEAMPPPRSTPPAA